MTNVKYKVIERILHRHEPDEWKVRLITDTLNIAIGLVQSYEAYERYKQDKNVSWFITVEETV